MYLTDEQRAERERKRARARQRVYKRLACRYPAEFSELYEAELEAEGLLPKQSPGPAPRELAVIS